MACDSRSHSRSRLFRSPQGACPRNRSLALLLAVFWLSVSAVGVHAQDIEEGGEIFLAECAKCHTVGGGTDVGPDLKGVVDRRDPAWLSRWILEPEAMLAEDDPIAVQLFNEFDQAPMPTSDLDEAQVESVIAYIQSMSDQPDDARPATAVRRLPPAVAIASRELGGVQALALVVFALITAIVISVFVFVANSTATPQEVDLKSAYSLRKIFFISGLAVLVCLLVITLPSNPYDVRAEQADEIVYVTARQYSFLYSREPVTSIADIRSVATLPVLEIAPDTLVEFRVTSLDATHGFAVYNPTGAIIAQTQAMPGYINRLSVRFDEPGSYAVLCLEFCGMAHHNMRSVILVDAGEPGHKKDLATE